MNSLLPQRKLCTGSCQVGHWPSKPSNPSNHDTSWHHEMFSPCNWVPLAPCSGAPFTCLKIKSGQICRCRNQEACTACKFYAGEGLLVIPKCNNSKRQTNAAHGIQFPTNSTITPVLSLLHHHSVLTPLTTSSQCKSLGYQLHRLISHKYFPAIHSMTHKRCKWNHVFGPLRCLVTSALQSCWQLPCLPCQGAMPSAASAVAQQQSRAWPELFFRNMSTVTESIRYSLHIESLRVLLHESCHVYISLTLLKCFMEDHY